MLLSWWRAVLLLSGLVLGAQAHAWSVGIGGVISIGSDGPMIRTGPAAQGVNIPLPNCGGDICNALEKGKNEITGENERRRAQEDVDNAARELGEVNAEVAKINATIAAVEAATIQDQKDFQDFKAGVAQNAAGLSEKYQTFVQDQAAIEPLLQQALDNVHIVRKEHAALSKGARASFEKLNRALAPETTIAARAIAMSLEDLALTPGSPVVALRGAVNSSLMVAAGLTESATQSAGLLASLSSDEAVKKFEGSLAGLEKSLEAQKQTAPTVLSSVSQSQQNVDKISRQVSATN